MKTTKIFLPITCALLMASCTGNFENENTNQAGFTPEQQQLDYQTNLIPLKQIQQCIYYNYGNGNWQFQIMQDLDADMFSGYFHDFVGSFNDKNSTYNLNDGWNAFNWTQTYGDGMTAVQTSEKVNTKESYPAFYGITKILKVEMMHRLADMFGPIIYTKFGSKTGSDPDDLKTAYYQFFTDLDDAITSIRSFQKANPNQETFANADILMPQGMRTYSEWIKFANSLRLRLALRIANVDAEKAKAEAQKSLTDAGGLLEDAKEVVAVDASSGYVNPLGTINSVWGEVHMNANMESYLVGYNDPRTEKYFQKSGTDPGLVPVIHSYEGLYKGVRQGTGVSDNRYGAHSPSTIMPTTNAILMSAAEVWFLRAEAALRGWSSESAKTCYERGVQTSFDQWSAGDATAYLNSDNEPADYIDAFDSNFDAKAQSTITPKWDDAATKEQKLERISVQKWLACYPEGCEAWANQRRTGYPKLFKVVVNNSQGKISTDAMVRRIPFPASIENDNPDQYSKLKAALGGDDTGGTRLWWDTGSNNL